MDYRDTLNLLRTDFPMRGNLAEREPQILRMWQEMDIYGMVRELRAGAPTYILHDGPPYANGDIHLGQALNKILKDITIKYKTMRGFDCPYIPGWDTQGLPTEQSVQRERNVFPHDVPVLQWRRLCRELALGYVDTQREQFKRIGVRGDWDNPYLTLSPEYQARQIKAFGKIALSGLLYRALRPVYWCYHCETALAEDEIEYATRPAPAIYVAFEIIDRQHLPMDEPPAEPVSFLIWTTTPWTIPGNTAIALSESAEYVLVDTPRGHFILAQELLDRSMAECQITRYQVVARFTGGELEGLVTKHPMYDRQSPVVLADYVTVEDGTGAVHTAPGHGLEDYETALAYDLDIVSPLDDLGRYTAEAGEELAGEVADQSNEIVTGILRRRGALIGEAQIEHEYPHCWRCHQPVIYRATRQWFMDIERLREKALKAVRGVEWNPEWGESRISGMIESRPDWCISRQRTWGVPIPVFYCTRCGEPLITPETIEHLRDLVAQHGADVWWEREAEELLPENTTCPADGCDGTHFRKEPDIMSVWVDSGCSHYCVVRPHPELDFPADLYLEGDDQYQCWFQTSLWVAMALGDPAPYRTVVGHGFFVDETGQKLSKSRGNIISPAEVYEQYGADVLRLWFTYADFRQKMVLSDSIFQQVADAYRRIRNTTRFLLQNLQDFDPSEDSLPVAELREIDRWALDRLQRRIRAITDAYERWDLHIVYRELHAFCDQDLSAFYLNVLKDRLYTDLADSPARRSAQTAMWRTLLAIVKMMAPVLTFTSEEAWQHMRREVDEALPASVQLADWPEGDESLLDEDLAERYRQFLGLRGVATAALEEAKDSGEVPNPMEARLDLYVSDAARDVLEALEEDLWSLFIVSDVKLHHISEAEEEFNEPSGMHAEASLAAGDKCARCWMRAESTGMIQEHPELCSRCAERVSRILSG
ncbi:MAG: isoleucine--tRNA ligase [Armatimonadota bacterium]|nr:isoleucine--tRNA ligase [Armatimonadota bacterium]